MTQLSVTSDERLRILVLYDEASTHTSTVLEHLSSIKTFSRHEVCYASGVRNVRPLVGLDAFDVVIVHYSVRLSFPDFISPAYADALPGFRGLKFLFIQDEYDQTETARTWMERLRFDVIFTCVPPRFVEAVYPQARFPKTEFITTLTGFVPPRYEAWSGAPPMSARKIAIAYRGRALPFRYGRLGQEKQVIGVRMRELCRARGVPHDIEWDDAKRIYGDAWYQFIMSARATLGTESGSNVFDDHGEIARTAEAELARNPALSFEEYFEKHLVPHEGKVMMNQISPRVFEAVALRTGLILFRGEYSGVVQPDEHYIPLEKDFSNIDEVLTRLQDDDYMEAMVERAHRDVIRSGKYSYRVSVGELDALIARKGRRVRTQDPMMVMLAPSVGGRPQDPNTREETLVVEAITSEPLLWKESRAHLVPPLPRRQALVAAVLRNSPRRVRKVMGPAIGRLGPLIFKLWRE